MNEKAASETLPRQRGRFSAIELLIALVLLLCLFPFVEHINSGDLIISFLFTIVLVAGVIAIARRASTLMIGTLLALPTVAGRWANHFLPDQVPPEIFLVAGILFMLFVIGNLLSFVLRAPAVNTEVLCASISAYLLLGLLWTLAYWLVAELVPGAFSFNTSSGAESMQGFNGAYFSFITLCTVGYGDITPVAGVARMLAAMEAITGLLYVAILIARLVSIHAGTPKSDDQ